MLPLSHTFYGSVSEMGMSKVEHGVSDCSLSEKKFIHKQYLKPFIFLVSQHT